LAAEIAEERPDWRDREQLSRRDWQLRLLKKKRPDWRDREQISRKVWQLRLASMQHAYI